MEVTFTTKKLQKVFNSDKELVRKHGPRRAELIRECLDDLQAVETLASMKDLPQHRCHELKANRKGELSLDLDHPYRLILKPNHHPVPTNSDGGIDWHSVTAVEIQGVDNTHGK